jgi:hypothetical protein
MKANTRLLKIMEELEWRDIPNWTKVHPKLKEAEVLNFKAWFKDNLQHIPEHWRMYLEEYVLGEGERLFTKKEFAHMTLARAVLKGVYAKEKEYGRQDTDCCSRS